MSRASRLSCTQKSRFQRSLTSTLNAMGTWFRSRVWLIDTLLLSWVVEQARTALLGFVLEVLYFRSMGAHVGKQTFLSNSSVRCGCDTLWLDDDIFCGSSVLFFTQGQHCQALTFYDIEVGKGCILANNAVLSQRVELAPNTS